jgi:hypothetical protein
MPSLVHLKPFYYLHLDSNYLILSFYRLSIASAQAFLLVYSVSDPLSFVAIKHRFEEIKEQRADFQVCLFY